MPGLYPLLLLYNCQHVLRARSLKITVRTVHIEHYLRFQLLDRAKLSLVTKTIQKSHTHNIAVKITVPVHYVGLNRRFRGVRKRRSQPHIRHAPAPLSINQRAGHVNAVPGYDAVVWVEVGRRKAQLVPAFRASLDTALDAVRTAQHASRKVHLTRSQ